MNNVVGTQQGIVRPLIQVTGTTNIRGLKFLRLVANVVAGVIWAAAVLRTSDSMAAGVSPGLDDWVSATSARVRYVVNSQGWGYDIPSVSEFRPNPIVISPNGRYFFFITEQGDLGCDCNVYQLWVYGLSSVLRTLREDRHAKSNGVDPLRTVSMRHEKDVAIDSAAWVEGGESVIEFLGRRSPGDARSLYRLHVDSGELELVISVPAAKELADHQRRQQGLVYTLRQKKERASSRYPFYPLTAQRVQESVLFGGPLPDYAAETYVRLDDRPPWVLKAGYAVTDPPWLSPDGRHAVVLRRPQHVPVSWLQYEDGITPASSRRTGDFLQFIHVNLETETESPVMDAPTGKATAVGSQVLKQNLMNRPQAFWSRDSRHVVLTNTALPLSMDAAAERARMTYLVSYDVIRKQWDILEAYQKPSGEIIHSVSWQKHGSEILVEHVRNGVRTSGSVYRHGESGWIPHTVDASVRPPVPLRQLAAWRPPTIQPALPQGLSLSVRKSANEPPNVVATLGKRELALMANDAALEGVRMARMEPLQWRDMGGVSHTSGLLLPSGKPSGRLPLVIQAGAYQPEVFHPDGPSRTAFAAQSLVAHGMAVINLDIPTLLPGVGGTPREVTLFMDWVEAAAKAAAAKYPIALDRVGLVGFSRSGYLVRYAITHPGHLRPAAAVVADSYTGSYALTLARYAMESNFSSEYDGIYGGEFFRSKLSWLSREVSFNVDRVQTPVLFADNNESLTLVLDTIGAFKANRKPFEYLIFPEGTHQLRTPRQREASLNATTEWMAFWLKDEVPADKERAERWLKIKADWETVKRSESEHELRSTSQ